MNIRIAVYVKMEPGDEPLLRELVADIADDLVARGYINSPEEEDAKVQSLIAVRQYPIDETDIEPYLQKQLEGAFLVVLPVQNKGEEDASEEGS